MPANVEIAALKETVKGGFESVTRRMDEAQQLSKERHGENVMRLMSIEAEAKKTNGRVSQLEAAAKVADQWPSLKTWLVIVGGTTGFIWFLLTSVLGFHRG